MSALFRYELKKLLSRRVVLVFALLCLAYTVWANWSLPLMHWSGLARGLKDVYSQFEGRVVTEGFKEEVRESVEQFMTDHPGQMHVFEQPDGTIEYNPSTPGTYKYITGISWAYNEILSNADSLEARQESVRTAGEALTLGKNQDGTPLTEEQRQSCESAVRRGVVAPVVHYAKGWELEFLLDSQYPGLLLLLLIVLAVSPLFSGERAARMEGILLCSAGRGRAAAAKMLAASACAGALALLFFAAQFLLVACTFGFDGALLPVTEGSAVSNLGALALALPALVLAAAACAAYVSLASALSRHTALALLLAGLFIATQFAPEYFIDQCVTNWLFGRIDNPALPPPWCYPLREYTKYFPPLLVNLHANLLGWMDGLKPVALAFAGSALLFLLVPRAFHRGRKT